MIDRYEWRGVLAGVYKGKKDVFLAHAANVETGETLCKKIPADHVSDAPQKSGPFCKACKKKMLNIY